MLYKGQKKIAEIYRGGKLIGKIYKGKTKLYDVNPYVKGQVLTEKSPDEYEVLLPRGVYKIAVGGAKGTNVSWAYAGAAWGASGGGGAFVEVMFFNPKQQALVIKAPASGAAVVRLGGQEVIRAHGGSNAAIASSGVGGGFEVSKSLDVVATIKTANGNNGGMAAYATPNVASVASYGNWGSSANAAGGARLEYIRYVR